MSAAKTINDMGADVAVVDGALEVMGLDRLPPHVVERVLEMAREHKEELVRELGAKAPGPVTGLEWLPGPPDSEGPAFDTWWAAFDLADLAKLYGVRVVHAGERILVIFQPDLPAELVAYASALLDDARPYLTANMDKLPSLEPAEAVGIVKTIMRQHPGLRFCRGEGGSRWPLYPKTWTAGQKAVTQSLWFIAGEALDLDDFLGVDA